MKAIVDAETCTGCELCVETCPEVFKMGDEEVAVIIADPVPAEAQETCQTAADDCPTEAIAIEQ